jgi:hypothetical protein
MSLLSAPILTCNEIFNECSLSGYRSATVQALSQAASTDRRKGFQELTRDANSRCALNDHSRARITAKREAHNELCG